ncbi:unnamed protein product, partial [Rotaria magnacalcarata]
WESVLSLSIISHATIVESLEAFFFKEELHGENLYECMYCQKKVPATRSLQISKALPVIFIQLKRFTYDKALRMIRKIHQSVTFPEILNLDCYFDQDIQELNKENNTIDNFVYKLKSVVVHLGENATSGHVFTYVRSPDETWYTANDESMKSTRLDTVLGDKYAYILCYTKVPKSSAILSDTNMIISPARSSLFLNSSTPINSSKIFDKNTNNSTTTRNNAFLY